MKKIITYIARDENGNQVSGELPDITNKQFAAKKLKELKLYPISIKLSSAKKNVTSKLNIELTKQKVTAKDLLLFCRQMHTMIKAGIPITNGLTRLADTTSNTTLQKSLLQMSDDIASGQSMSVSLGQHKDIFPAILRNIIAVGENTGRLEDSFTQVGNYLQLELETKMRLAKVMRYPAIVISAIVVAIVVVNIFVIPAFSSLFSSFNAELPIFTRILISVSIFFTEQWLYLLIYVFCGVLAIRYYLMTKQGEKVFASFYLKLPIIGKVLHKILLARFARTMLMIIKTGVPLNEGMEMVANSIDNLILKEKIMNMKVLMQKGESLSISAKEVELLPPLALQMLMIGEQTGDLDKMLQEVSIFYEREVDYEIDKIGDVIEPILLILIGGLVLVLALGVFLPIWELGSAVQT